MKESVKCQEWTLGRSRLSQDTVARLSPPFNIEARDNIFGIWETMFNRPSLCPHS